MDLLALCEGDFDNALACVDKIAIETGSGLSKEAAGLLDSLKGVGTDVSNYVRDHGGAKINDSINKNLGALGRSQAAQSMGSWWRDPANDPARLGLMGAAGGAGLGLAGSLAFGQKGRRRPGYGALLGGLMGGAALGGYGLLTRDPAKAQNAEQQSQVADEIGRPSGAIDPTTGKPGEATGQNLRVETANQALSPTESHRAAGRNFRAGNIQQGVQDLDYLGLGHFADFGVGDQPGVNDQFAPSVRVGKALRSVTGMGLTDHPDTATLNPALETAGIVGGIDATLSARRNSVSNPSLIRAGINDPTGADKIRNLAMYKNDVAGAQRAIDHIADPSTSGLRQGAGGVFGKRPISTGFQIPGVRPTSPRGALGPVISPATIPQETMRQIGAIGKGLRTPTSRIPAYAARAVGYLGAPTALEWGRTRPMEAQAARDQLAASQDRAKTLADQATAMKAQKFKLPTLVPPPAGP